MNDQNSEIEEIEEIKSDLAEVEAKIDAITDRIVHSLEPLIEALAQILAGNDGMIIQSETRYPDGRVVTFNKIIAGNRTDA